MTEQNSPLLSEQDERMWATLAHLGVLAGLVIPLGNILAPLIIWLTQKDKSEFVHAHAQEALNFQITVTLALVVSAILIIIIVGIVLMAAIAILSIVFAIIAAVAANKGEYYKYPFSLTFIK